MVSEGEDTYEAYTSRFDDLFGEDVDTAEYYYWRYGIKTPRIIRRLSETEFEIAVDALNKLEPEITEAIDNEEWDKVDELLEESFPREFSLLY